MPDAVAYPYGNEIFIEVDREREDEAVVDKDVVAAKESLYILVDCRYQLIGTTISDGDSFAACCGPLIKWTDIQYISCCFSPPYDYEALC